MSTLPPEYPDPDFIITSPPRELLELGDVATEFDPADKDSEDPFGEELSPTEIEIGPAEEVLEPVLIAMAPDELFSDGPV